MMAGEWQLANSSVNQLVDSANKVYPESEPAHWR